MNSTVLKRPTGVYIMAVLFLLAPIGNILISFAGSGVENWYSTGVLLPFLKSVPLLDWLWLSLLFVTGILLFRPHKLTWSLAIFTLLLVLGINAYRLFNVDSNSIDPAFLKAFSVMAILSTLSVLVIAFYFRFPYLDRRTNWLSNSPRLEVKTEALVDGVKAETESVSQTGCRLSFEGASKLQKNKMVTLFFPAISKTEVLAEVVEDGDTAARVEFRDPGAFFKQDLDRWLKSRS